MPSDEYADEIDRLEARSASDPRTHTFARLADLYRKAGELQRALEVVESGLRHHPHYLNARIVHARLLRELGRQGEAIAAFERVLRIDSQNLVAQAALTELREGGAGQVRGVTEAPEPRPAASGWLARLEEDWHSGRERHDEPEDVNPEGATLPEAGPRGELDEPRLSGETGQPSEPGEPKRSEPETDEIGTDEPDHAPKREPVESRRAAGPGAGVTRPPTAIRREGGDLETATLAELYARQGLFDEAIGIFERLLARDPYNARLAAALEDARHQARGKGSSNGQGGRDDAAEPVPDDAEEPMPEDAVGPATVTAARPDPRRGEARTERSAGAAMLSSGAPVPAAREAPTDSESIRAFLARLLEGRFETPGGEAGGDDVELDEWLEARRA